MAKKPLTTKNTLLLIWNTINFVRKLIINIVFFPIFILVLIVAVVAISSDNELKVEPGSALVLNLSGSLVDQARRIDPITQMLTQGNANDENAEVLLSDLLYVIDNATHDERIGAIVLDLSGMNAGISKLTAVGEALKNFREAGKKVIAIGDWYGRSQYYLASYADEIYLNPRGEVFVDGYAAYNLYFKSALEKLKVKTHVFRVGTYKSAVEPYIRDDMSPAAREATQLLIDDLWSSYAATVAANRGIETSELVLDADTYLTRLNEFDGDSAELAVKQGWVDGLKSDEEFRQAMIELVGEESEEHSFRQVHFHDYFKLVQPQPQLLPVDSVGVIVAKGTIMNGYQAPGDIGGKSTAELIREARFDDSIKAVVLRVDSPGGSAFASEEIRQELLALKAAGKPVVVSMGSMAASGGYWISASADYIYATPTTLTGSIGIFGLITTFEDSLAAIGVHADGVATSEWAAHSPFKSLSPKLEAAIQRNIERGYKEFISLVADERGMSLEQVDAIAQGRVWSGKKALELGLVDELGDMPEALSKAAELAGMETFDTQLIEQQMSPEELFIQEMFASASALLPQSARQSSLVDKLMSVWGKVLEDVARFDDPKGAYLYCEYCQLQ
ncbi:signal peptide peptidase SppA [Shewanella khirikhana]|uniref:Protease 4 n=1 Tax=Shewanella khirikhana TaxID=1965282 RepID=A0ABM7DNB9_9GAMM|nr:signal peptide peptidase SppA [Shewanella khirikhana]AZQ10521.1 Protease 4 [Shewanella khirikhana]